MTIDRALYSLDVRLSRARIEGLLKDWPSEDKAVACLDGWAIMPADLRAALAPIAITDDLVAIGVAGIQRRDAEGWADEDEQQINHELARAVLMAVLGAEPNPVTNEPGPIKVESHRFSLTDAAKDEVIAEIEAEELAAADFNLSQSDLTTLRMIAKSEGENGLGHHLLFTSEQFDAVVANLEARRLVDASTDPRYARCTDAGRAAIAQDQA